MTIGERIKIIRDDLGLSRAKFGASLGVSGDVINNIERDRLSRPEQKESLYRLICKEYGISYDWLLSGKGEMKVSASYNTEAEEIAAFAGEVINCPDESFKRRLILALTKLDEKGWENLEAIIDKLNERDS